MKILMISTDANILKEGSAARKRMAEYGAVCGELNILIPTVGGEKISVKIADNVFAHPTASANKLFSRIDLLRRRNIQADLVTSQDPFETGFLAWRIAKRLGAKLELQIHTDFLSPYFWRESFINKIRVILAKFLLPKADGVRVVSRRIFDFLNAKLYKLKVTPVVLPIFVDVEKIKTVAVRADLRQKYPQFDFIILMVSRLSGEKNIGLAIKAMRDVVKKHPKTGLVIAGSGPEQESLKLQAVRYKLQENVVFEGWRDDIISYYKSADLFLNSSNYEGYGLSLAEAALSECPIVTTDVGIAVELQKSGAPVSICPVGDKNCLAAGITKNISSGPNSPVSWQPPRGFFDQDKQAYLEKLQESWQGCFGLVR